MTNISVTNVSEFGIRKIKIAKDKIIGGGIKICKKTIVSRTL